MPISLRKPAGDGAVVRARPTGSTRWRKREAFPIECPTAGNSAPTAVIHRAISPMPADTVAGSRRRRAIPVAGQLTSCVSARSSAGRSPRGRSSVGGSRAPRVRPRPSPTASADPSNPTVTVCRRPLLLSLLGARGTRRRRRALRTRSPSAGSRPCAGSGVSRRSRAAPGEGSPGRRVTRSTSDRGVRGEDTVRP